MNLFKKFWLRKATNDVTPSVTAGEEVLPRPASMAFVPSKDVVARAIDLSHTISDYDLLKRTLGQEFGLNDEEVTQVLGAVIPQMVSDEESTTVTSETERNPVNNPAEADERPLDNPQSTEEHKPLSKSIESLYYEGYDNQEIAKTLKVSQAVIDDYVINNLEPIIHKVQSLAKDHLVHDIKDELRSARHYMSLAEQDSEHAKEFMDIASDEVEHQHKLREIENEEEQKEAFQAAASKKGGAFDTTMPIKKSNTNSFKKLWGAITNFGQWGGYRQRKVLENPTNFKKHWMLTKSSRSDQEVYYLAKEMCKMMEKNPDFDPRPYLEGVGLVDADIVRVLKKAIELQKAGKVAKSLPPYLENVRDELMDLLQNGDFDPERAWTEDAKKFLREDKGLTDQEVDEVIHDIEEEFDMMTNKSQRIKKDTPYHELIARDAMVADEIADELADRGITDGDDWREDAIKLIDEKIKNHEWDLTREEKDYLLDDILNRIGLDLAMMKKGRIKKDMSYMDVVFANEIADELADQGITEDDNWRKEALKLIDEKVKNHEWDLTEEEKNNLLDDILNSVELDLAMMEEEEKKSINSRLSQTQKDISLQNYDIGYRCNLCGQEFVPYTDQQLISHLKTKHPQQFKEVQEAETNNGDLMVWDFFTKIRRARKSQVKKSNKAEWWKMAENLINRLQRKADANPKAFGENFGEKEVRAFEEKLNQENTLSYGDKTEIMRMVYDKVDNLAPHFNKTSTIEEEILNASPESSDFTSINSSSLNRILDKYGSKKFFDALYKLQDEGKIEVNNHITRTIASQLREVGWTGPIVSWDKNSVKINSGDAGVIISYNEGSDSYRFLPYKGTEAGTPKDDMYVDDLPLVFDLIDEMKKKPPQKTAKGIQKAGKRYEVEILYRLKGSSGWKSKVYNTYATDEFEAIGNAAHKFEDEHAGEDIEYKRGTIRIIKSQTEGVTNTKSSRAVQKDDESPSAKMKRQELEEFYAGLLKIVRSDPNWQPRVRRILVDNDFENVETIMQWLKEDQHTLAQESSEKSQKNISKRQLAYGVEGEIELEAESNFGPFSTREEVENNVLWAIENIKEWLTDKKELAELESIANNPKKIKDIVDRICEDYDIKKSSKNKVEKPGRSIHSAKFDRCVAHVKASGTAENPYAVCTAVLGDEAFKSQNTELSPAEIKLIDQEINKRESKQRLQKDTPTTELPNPLEVGRYEYNGHTIHVWENTQENERYYSVDESPKMFAHEKDARASVMPLKETKKWENGQSHYYA